MSDAVAPWRLRVAIVIVALLAIGLGVTTRIGVPGSTDQTSASGMGSDTTSGPSATNGATLERVTTVTIRSDDEVRRTVQYALAAWGVFAGSGDLADVEGFFDPHGPQWSMLEEEAGSVGTPFVAEVEEASLVFDGRFAVFRASVTLMAERFESRGADWAIELRPGLDGRWLIWSIRDLTDG